MDSVSKYFILLYALKYIFLRRIRKIHRTAKGFRDKKGLKTPVFKYCVR